MQKVIIFLTMILITIGVGFPIFLTYGQEQGQHYQTIQVFKANLGLQPGQGRLYNFTIPNATNIYLRGNLYVSGGIVNTITFNLYDAKQCPPPDSTGNLDWNSCTGVIGKDYQSGEIDQYIPHGGTFYLVLRDGSSYFNKVVNGNIYVEYLR